MKFSMCNAKIINLDGATVDGAAGAAAVVNGGDTVDGAAGGGGDDDDYEWEYFYEDVDEAKKDNQDAPVAPAQSSTKTR